MFKNNKSVLKEIQLIKTDLKFSGYETLRQFQLISLIKSHLNRLDELITLMEK